MDYDDKVKQWEMEQEEKIGQVFTPNQYDTLGEFLKAKREALGLTQAQMGHALRIPQSTLSRYENNFVQPSIVTLVQMAPFMQYDINDVLHYVTTREP